jgi:hypothetical protein
MKASEVKASYEYPIINADEVTYRILSAELKPDNGGDSHFVVFHWEGVSPDVVVDEAGKPHKFGGNASNSAALYIKKDGISKFPDKKGNPQQDGGARWLKNLDEKLGLVSEWDTETLTQADFDRYALKVVTGAMSTTITNKDGQEYPKYKLGKVKSAAQQYQTA